jgi:hypothetical protein
MPRIVFALAAATLLAACHQQAQSAAGTAAPVVVPGPAGNAKGPAPAPAAVTVAPAPQPTPSAGASTPTISLAEGSTTLTVTPPPTPCGAEKLFNYLNLIPTSTAKEEIARSLGHARIRYVPLKPAPAMSESKRVTAEIGADGRIKKFTCG